MVLLCVAAQGEEGSPWPSPASQHVSPLLGWCSGLPRRGQGSEGSELSIPPRWSHQGRKWDGSTTAGTTTGRATKASPAAGTGLCGHLPSVLGHTTPPVASLWQETCATTLHPTATPLPSPQQRCQPGSAQPLVPLLVFVHSQTPAKQKQIPQQLKVPFLWLG